MPAGSEDAAMLRRIQAGFEAELEDERAHRVWETTLRRSARRPPEQAPLRPMRLGLAATSAAILTLAIALVLSSGGSGLPGLAEVAAGVERLAEQEGVLHYRVDLSSLSARAGESAVRTDLDIEYWVDSDRGSLRREARSTTGTVSAGAWIVDAKGRVDSLEATDGRAPEAASAYAGCPWIDALPSAIEMLQERAFQDNGVVVGREEHGDVQVVLVRNSERWAEPGGTTSELVRTFWLRESDFMPLRIREDLAETAPDGRLVSSVRNDYVLSGHEVLPYDELPNDLFDRPLTEDDLPD